MWKGNCKSLVWFLWMYSLNELQSESSVDCPLRTLPPLIKKQWWRRQYKLESYQVIPTWLLLDTAEVNAIMKHLAQTTMSPHPMTSTQHEKPWQRLRYLWMPKICSQYLPNFACEVLKNNRAQAVTGKTLVYFSIWQCCSLACIAAGGSGQHTRWHNQLQLQEQKLSYDL